MNRHPLDAFSLVSGLLLTGIAVAALTGLRADVTVWLWPSLLIALGVAVLAAILQGSAATPDGVASDAPHGDPAVLDAARAEVEQVDVTTDGPDAVREGPDGPAED